MKIRELFSDPSKWTSGTYARDANGMPLYSDAKRYATSWCLVGAVERCYPPDVPEGQLNKYDVLNLLWHEINAGGTNIGVATFNDNSTYVTVKALVDKLNI